jgi:hypothetical protein
MLGAGDEPKNYKDKEDIIKCLFKILRALIRDDSG